MDFNLKKYIDEKGILVAAHRGVNGGNIPCNSMECYKLACSQGADIIEMDVTACKNREELFMLHPGMEHVHSNVPHEYWLGDLTKAEVEKYVLKNQDLTDTQYRFVTFGDTLDALKGKCFLNVDKFWDNPDLIAAEIRKRDMQNQVIVKSDPNNGKIMDAIEQFAPDMQFIAVISDPAKACHEELKRRNINYVGVEVLFDSDEHAFVQDDFIKRMHDEGKIIWGNSIVYNYRANISGIHTDDCALLCNKDIGWGFYGEKKFDIVQTDWLLPCLDYLKSKGYRK